MPEQKQTAVAVAGGGMGGLVSAVQAVERGCDVIVLEKGPQLGGSMRLAAGFLWTYDPDTVRDAIPHGDPDLQALVTETLPDGWQWIEDHGVEIKERPFQLPSGQDVWHPNPGEQEEKIDTVEFIERAREILDDHDAEVLLETPFEELRTDDDGNVVGARARNGETAVDIDADAVVVATGGFQGNEELVQRHVTQHTENVVLRSNPWSTGDGLLAAKDAGAQTTEGMGWFYGHNVLAPPAEYTNEQFVDVTQYYGPYAVALDRDGERYTDESESVLEHTLSEDTAKLADGKAFLVVDQDLYEGEVASGGPVKRRIDRAMDVFDGPAETVDSLSAVADVLAEWGANGDNAVETVLAFNRAVENDDGLSLNPPRERFQNPIDTPPFYVVEVRPGITFTMGGLSIDTDCRVLRRTDSAAGYYMDENGEETRETPIAGLFAAGSDVGNISHRHYMGGLAQALTTGLVAGESAADYANDQ